MDNIEAAIEKKLREALNPVHFEVKNDSAKHAGHAGDDGSGQTHYRVTIVSSTFDGKSRVERHRMIHDLLEEEFATGLHALVLKALSPEEAK